MSLEYEKKKAVILKEMIENYKKELWRERDIALDMPIETENGFNVERESIITDIDEKMEILRRHEKDPYFAKLMFTDIEDGQEFVGYIGRVSVGDVQDPSDEKIVDWRAPISDLYYNGRIGESRYTALDREYTVDLKLKRQIVFDENGVKNIHDFEDQISNDEFLTPFLTQSANNRLKSIVSTIQEEQNKIIRLPIGKNSIVQGVAGSGKTTVALHRLSYLIYNYKRYAKAEDFLIISPNEIFMSYISSILVDLEADKSNSFSLNKVFEFAVGNEYKILNKHDQYEKLKSKKISTDYLSFKNSLEFANVIDRYVEDYIYNLFHRDIKAKTVQILEADDIIKFYDNPYKNNVSTLAVNGSRKLAFELMTNEDLKLKAFRKINQSDLSITKKYELKNLVESGNYGFIKANFNTNFKITNLYKEFITNVHKFTDYKDIGTLQTETLKNLKNKTFSYDDLGAVLYLYSKFMDVPYFEKLKCVFLDEAQDLSSIMYLGLRKLLKNAKFSIFGDIAQGIYNYQSIDNWEEVKDIIGDCEIMYLNRSYRTSIEIMAEANNTLAKLGVAPANNVVRHGEEVEFVKECNFDTFKNQLSVLNSKFSNTAIICKDTEELRKAEKMLEDLNLAVLDESNLTYGKVQNTLLTVQTAKGLEFDSVIIFDNSSYTDSALDLRLLYVAKTRALHKLIINGCK